MNNVKNRKSSSFMLDNLTNNINTNNNNNKNNNNVYNEP